MYPPIPEKDKNLDRAEILNVAKSVNTNLKTINILTRQYESGSIDFSDLEIKTSSVVKTLQNTLSAYDDLIVQTYSEFSESFLTVIRSWFLILALSDSNNIPDQITIQNTINEYIQVEKIFQHKENLTTYGFELEALPENVFTIAKNPNGGSLSMSYFLTDIFNCLHIPNYKDGSGELGRFELNPGPAYSPETLNFMLSNIAEALKQIIYKIGYKFPHNHDTHDLNEYSQVFESQIWPLHLNFGVDIPKSELEDVYYMTSLMKLFSSEARILGKDFKEAFKIHQFTPDNSRNFADMGKKLSSKLEIRTPENLNNAPVNNLLCYFITLYLISKQKNNSDLNSDYIKIWQNFQLSLVDLTIISLNDQIDRVNTDNKSTWEYQVREIQKSYQKDLRSGFEQCLSFFSSNNDLFLKQSKDERNFNNSDYIAFQNDLKIKLKNLAITAAQQTQDLIFQDENIN